MKQIKRIIVMMLTVAMLVTGSGIGVFADSLQQDPESTATLKMAEAEEESEKEDAKAEKKESAEKEEAKEEKKEEKKEEVEEISDNEVPKAAEDADSNDKEDEVKAEDKDSSDSEEKADADKAADEEKAADEDKADDKESADADKEEKEEAAKGIVLKKQTLEAEITDTPKDVADKEDRLKADKNAEITLTGEMPEGAYVKAYPVKVEIEGRIVISAYDITIYIKDEDGKEVAWQPKEALSVSIKDSKVKKAADDKDAELSVFHMEDMDAKPEQIGIADMKKDGVSFDADQFSIYIISEDENQNANHAIYNFWLSKSDIGQDGKTPYRVISLNNGEALLEPAAPSDTGSGKFTGWKYAENDAAVNFDNVTASVPEDATADIVVDIYAEFDGEQYATFMSLPINGKRSVFSKVTMIKDSDTYKVTELPSYGAPDGYKFVGWTTTEPSDSIGYGTSIEKSNYHKLGEEISGQTGSITLYPVCKKMHNLTFDGNGGLVKGLPVYKVLATSDDSWEEVLSKLGEVKRSGHTRVDGWYSGPDTTDSVVSTTNDIALTDDTTVYAHWTEAKTTVTVKYWKEDVNKDAKGNSTYFELDEETFEVDTGSTITIDKTAMTLTNNRHQLNYDTIRGYFADGDTYHDKLSGDGKYIRDLQMKYFYVEEVSAVDTEGIRHFDAVHPDPYSNPSATHSEDLSFKVAEDGSTIINVWYDRKTYNVRFVFKGDAMASGAYVKYGGIFGLLPHESIDTVLPSENTYYQIRLGESTSGFWPNVTERQYQMLSLTGTFGYMVTSLGPRASGNNYPEAVDALFDIAPRTVPEELLDLADGSGNIVLWARYNDKVIRGGLTVATVNEYYQDADGNYPSNPNRQAQYYYGRGTSSDPAEPFTTLSREGYVLDITSTTSNNGGSSYVTVNEDGTASIKYRTSGNNAYTANVYYKCRDDLAVNIQWEDKLLVNGSDIKYSQPIGDYIESRNSLKLVYDNPVSAARGKGLPNFMEFEGWYIDREYTDEYDFHPETLMPNHTYTLFAHFVPKTVSVLVDNNKDGDQSRTNPPLNMTGSEMGASIRYLDYKVDAKNEPYGAHMHTLAEYIPTCWVNPVWEDHVFTGWEYSILDDSAYYADENHEQWADWNAYYNDAAKWSEYRRVDDLNMFVDGHIKVRATWQNIKRHSIHYKENGKEVYLDTNAYAEGTTIVLKGSDTEIYENDTSHVFRYWTLEGDSTNKPYYPGDTITMGDSDITLNAQFGAGASSSSGIKATYTFKVPNGSGWKTYYEEIVYKGERLSPPPEEPESTESGETFRGWYTDQTLKNKFNGFGNVNAPKDTVLYAKFAKSYQVTYKGLSEETITVQTYDDGEYLDTTGVGTNYSHNGQSPEGWWETKLNQGEPTGDLVHKYGYNGRTSIQVTADMTLYPVFEKYFTLHFDTQGGTELPDKIYGESENLNFTWPEPDDVAREDYTFTGKWYYDRECTNEFNWNTTLTGDTTIYAGWVLNDGVTLKSQYTIAWWVEKADSNGDRNDISNYYYSNSEVVDNVDVGTEIGRTTEATANGSSAANNVAHVNTSNIPAGDRGYFEFYMAKVSYAKGLSDDGEHGTVKTLENDGAKAKVDKSGKTTLNIFISRKRYPIQFKLNGIGKISYKQHSGNNAITSTWNWMDDGSDETSDLTEGWYEMPWAGRWPALAAEGENVTNDTPALEMNSGKGYGGWLPTGSTTTWVTNPRKLEASDIAAASSGTIVYNLQEKTQSVSTYWARYRFRDPDDEQYSEYDYNGNNYDQAFNSKISSLQGKEFIGYKRDNATADATGSVTELKSAYGVGPYYYTDNNNYNSSNKHYVTFRFSESGDAVEIVEENGGVYNGQNRIFYKVYDSWYNSYSYNNSSYMTPANIRNVSSSYYEKVNNSFTYYYTRKTSTITLHDSRTPNSAVDNGTKTLMVGEPLAGVVDDTTPCGTYNMTPPTGKEFDSWSLSAESVVPIKFSGDGATADTMTENPLQLYAHWRIIQVTITAIYDEDDIRPVTKDINTQFKHFGFVPADIPGKVFKGWQVKGTTRMLRSNEQITESLTIEPVYEDLRADAVVYDLNGGTVKVQGDTVIEGCRLYADAPEGRVQYKDINDYVVYGNAPVKALNLSNITIPDGTKEIYFWSTEPDGSGHNYYPGDVIEMPAKPAKTVLYAIYAPRMDTKIMYDLNYTGSPDPVVVEFKDYLDTNKLTGEYKVNDGYIAGTRYVNEEYVPITFKVGSEDHKISTVRPGYTFKGWDKKQTLEAGKNPEFKDGDKLRIISYDRETGAYQDVHTLYAQWEADTVNIEAYKYEDDDNSTAQEIDGSIGKYLQKSADTTWKGVEDVASAYKIQKGYSVDNEFEFRKAVIGNDEVDKMKYVLKTDGTGYEWQYHKAGTADDVFETVGDKTLEIYYHKYNDGVLTISNNVVGDYSDLEKEFTFKIHVDGMDDQTVKLKHGGSQDVVLPRGKEITVTQIGADAYTATFEAGGYAEKLDGVVENGTKVKLKGVKDAGGVNTATLDVTNSLTENVVPSGINDHNSIMYVMLMVMIFTAWVLVSIRRRRQTGSR